MSDLNEKLRTAEEREATLLIELSELREQNELLEFRLLELEETSVRKDSFAHAANSIISAELSLANKVFVLYFVHIIDCICLNTVSIYITYCY